MSLVRYISDPHFFHKNEALRRGFNDEFHMNEFIIENWNKSVTSKDVTWILGDITMEKPMYAILDRLNGIKKVILGNHDRPQDVKELLKHVNYVCSSYKIKNKNGVFILTHIPIHESQLSSRYTYNIHGHVHKHSLPDKRYINVCMENVNYIPKLITELI